jgi:hypothetical protein
MTPDEHSGNAKAASGQPLAFLLQHLCLLN